MITAIGIVLLFVQAACFWGSGNAVAECDDNAAPALAFIGVFALTVGVWLVAA